MNKKEQFIIEDKSIDRANIKVEERIPDPGPLVIKAAVAGALLSRKQNPHIPYSPEEIAKEGIACLKAGACAIHIHVRDRYGIPSYVPEYYREIIYRILEQFPDAYIDGCTTRGETFENRMAVVNEGYLEMSPINTLSGIIGDEIVIFTPDFQQKAAKLMKEKNVKPEIGIWDSGHVNNAYRFLIKPGLIEKPYAWITLLGMPGIMPGGPDNLIYLINQIKKIDPEPLWMTCCGGRMGWHTVITAILLGGHVRVGLEDTMYKWGWKDDIITSNAECVERIVRISELFGRRIATSDEYRRLLGQKKRERDKDTMKLL